MTSLNYLSAAAEVHTRNEIKLACIWVSFFTLHQRRGYCESCEPSNIHSSSWNDNATDRWARSVTSGEGFPATISNDIIAVYLGGQFTQKTKSNRHLAAAKGMGVSSFPAGHRRRAHSCSHISHAIAAHFGKSVRAREAKSSRRIAAFA